MGAYGNLGASFKNKGHQINALKKNVNNVKNENIYKIDLINMDTTVNSTNGIL